MFVGDDHEDPFRLISLPPASTATQKADEGHDTDTRELLPSMLLGTDHDSPFQTVAFPWLSTATQNCSRKHEMEVNGTDLNSMGTGDPHEPLFDMTAFP